MKYLVFLILKLSCSKTVDIQKSISYNLVDKFVDSTNIGLKGKTKVVVEKFKRNDNKDFFVIVNFYKKDSVWNFKTQKNIGYVWNQTDKLFFEKDEVSGIDAEVKDFNNDEKNDFKYRSNVGGRGGNGIYKLFIYNPKSSDFTYIKNAENFPNLYYNNKLNCINSIILTGSTSTVFLKIKQDSLYDFARVDVSDSIIVKEKDDKGKYQIIEKKKFIGSEIDFYSGFSNFKPLEN